MFRRLTSVVLLALAAACGGGQPQARPTQSSAQSPPASPSSSQSPGRTPAGAASQTAAIQQALPEPIEGYEYVRQFTGRAKTIARGERMSFMFLTNDAQPELKSLLHKELGLGAFELGEETTRQAGDSWLVGYDVRFEGIRLSTASADVIVGIDGSDVRRVRVRNVPKAGVDGMRNTVSAEAALAIAKGQSARATGVAPESEKLETTKPELVFEAGRNEFEKAQLCWLVTVRVDDDVRPHQVQYAIKAIGDPVVVRAESLVREDHFGTVSGVRWEVTPVQAGVERVLPFARLSRATPPASSDADANGKYRFTGTGAATVKGSLASPFFRILNYSKDVKQLEPSRSGSDAAAIDLKFTGTHEHEIAQASAFFWAHRARTFAGAALSDADLQNVEVRVNVEATCSSSFEPPLTPGNAAIVRLFRGGPDSSDSSRRCVNRAYADTVSHEYGHAIDWFLGRNGGGMGAKAYAEGFADALAILFTRSDCYGRDAAGPKSCLRSAINTVEWPGTGVTDEHKGGQIYSGFVFELVQALKATMNENDAYELALRLTIRAAKDNPSNIQQAVDYMLTYDDNDGIRRNGTPHLAAFKKAAQKKKLWKTEWDPAT